MEKAVLAVIVRCAMSLRIRFRFDGKCILHPRYGTQGGMDGHSMEIVKGVNLCTSLIFTSGSRTEGPQKGRELWFERSPTPTNNAESTKMHHLKISTLAECKYGRQELTVRVRNKQ